MSIERCNLNKPDVKVRSFGGHTSEPMNRNHIVGRIREPLDACKNQSIALSRLPFLGGRLFLFADSFGFSLA